MITGMNLDHIIPFSQGRAGAYYNFSIDNRKLLEIPFLQTLTSSRLPVCLSPQLI
jgi:hypothetical protein